MKKLQFYLLPVFLLSTLIVNAQNGFQQNGSSLYYNNGNVGIGTSSPTQKLEVKGKVAISPGSINTDYGYNGNLILTKPALSGQYINLIRSEAYPWSIGMVYNTNTFAIGTGKANDSQFTSPFLSINANGNVGIGVSDPEFKLDILGTSRTTDLVLNGKIGRELSDTFNYQNQVIGHYSQTWAADSDYLSGYTLWLSGYGGIKFFTGGNVRFMVNNQGNIGIGTSNPGAKLDVIGDIRAHEVKVCLNQGCDYVFDDNYNLLSLDDLEKFITAKKHLPEIDPAVIMESQGINLSEMNAKLLQKIEEQTLYIITLNKQIKNIMIQLETLKQSNNIQK